MGATMATLRSGTKLEKLDANGNKNTVAETSDKVSEKTDKLAKVDNSKTVWVIFISLLIDLLAFTLILPLFPALISHYREHDASGLFKAMEDKVKIFQDLVGAPDRFNTVLFGGFIGSLFSFLQFVSSPIIGGLSDRFGRKPLMLLSATGIAFSYLLWAMSSNFTIFILARSVGGIFKGNVSLSTAIITDVSTAATRSRGMALVGIAFSIGFLIGPIIGAAFSVWREGQGEFWYVYPAVFALFLAVLDIVFIAIFFTESLPEFRRHGSTADTLAQIKEYLDPRCLFAFSSLRNLEPRKLASLQQVGLLYFIYLFLYSGMEFTLTFLTHLRFDFTSMQQGKMFLFIGTLMAIFQGGYVRRIPPGSEKKVAMRGLLLIVPSYAIVGMSGSVPMLYLGLAFYAISTAIVVPCLTSLVSQFGDHHQKGIIIGVFRSLGALGRAFGPIFGSLMYWSLGPEISYGVCGFGLLVPYFLLKKVNT